MSEYEPVNVKLEPREMGRLDTCGNSFIIQKDGYNNNPIYAGVEVDLWVAVYESVLGHLKDTVVYE